MAENQLFIPTKLKVGFQKRADTYTGNLAYVIYYDQKGKLRKENSWESWRSKDIDPIEIVNEPIEGFVLNKKVGGYKSDWNYRSAHIRVYDPRNFEFEISLENLLFILRDCDCYMGKGLDGKFVYSWDGTELVLLPVTSENYKNSKEYTDLQSQGVLSKTLIEGASYLTKKQEPLVYVGRFVVHYNSHSYHRKNDKMLSVKMYVFWNIESNSWVFMKDLKSLAACISDTVIDNYSQLVVNFQNSKYGSKIVGLKIIQSDFKENSYYSNFVFEKDGWFLVCRENKNYMSNVSVLEITDRVKFINGDIESENIFYNKKMYPPNYPTTYNSNGIIYNLNKYNDVGFYIEPQPNNKLVAVLESGAEYAYIYKYSELGDKNYADKSESTINEE